MAMWGQDNFWDGIKSKNGANALIGLGTGLLSGNTFAKGLAAGGQGFMQGSELDQQYADATEKKQVGVDQENATKTWLEQQGFTDLVPLVDAGQADVALTEGMRRKKPKDPLDPTSDMQNYQFYANEELKAGRAPVSFMEFSNPTAAASIPSGYQRAQDGNGLSFIPGGPADPSTPAKTTEATRRNQQLSSMIGPELQTVEQNWDELASGANQAANAVPFGAGYGATSPGYQQATNSLATIAQSYLYSVSGAAAPAEEVKKLVDSVTPKPFESAQSIADKKSRIRQMAAAVQEAAGGAPMRQPAPGGQTSTGLSWSIEP